MPVEGSLSPAMQNAAFAARGLDWAYLPLPVEDGRLEDAVRGLAALGFSGANVTAPYKLEAARICETELPSVNTDGGAAAAFRAALPHARVFARRGEWPPDVRDADLVVNATSERDEALAAMTQGQALVDLPYPETATARAAREAGATVVTGLEVLVAQGAASFELWTGMAAPVEVMRAAVGLRP